MINQERGGRMKVYRYMYSSYDSEMTEDELRIEHCEIFAKQLVVCSEFADYMMSGMNIGRKRYISFFKLSVFFISCHNVSVIVVHFDKIIVPQFLSNFKAHIPRKHYNSQIVKIIAYVKIFQRVFFIKNVNFFKSSL